MIYVGNMWLFLTELWNLFHSVSLPFAFFHFRRLFFLIFCYVSTMRTAIFFFIQSPHNKNRALASKLQLNSLGLNKIALNSRLVDKFNSKHLIIISSSRSYYSALHLYYSMTTINELKKNNAIWNKMQSKPSKWIVSCRNGIENLPIWHKM